MNQIWLRATAESDDPVTLRLAHYEALHGLEGALNHHANTVLAEVLRAIGEDQRDVPARVFRALVNGDKIAGAVRRPCSFGELVGIAHGRPEAIRVTIEAFRDPSCNFLTVAPSGPLVPESTVDIGHESLIRQWMQLSTWTLEEAKAAQEYRYLEETARRWNSGSAPLLQMPYLGIALDWRARETPAPAWAQLYGGDFHLTMQFLTQSGAMQQRRRRLRRAGMFAGALLIVLGTLAGYGYARSRADQSARADADTRGDNYYFGQRGAQRDYSKALYYYKKAVALDDAIIGGDAYAEFSIGFLYMKGYGPTENYAKARHWLLRADADGSGDADNMLGVMYEEGYGVPSDSQTAMKWFTRGSHRGSAGAEDNIGKFYKDGKAVPKNYQLAMMHFKQAAAEGSTYAEYHIGQLYEGGLGVAKDLGQARQHYKAAADRGNTDAAQRLGAMYALGRGDAKDMFGALYWFQKATEGDDPNAELTKGYIYEVGLPRDYNAALFWYMAASRHGVLLANYEIGGLYENGRGVKKDYKKAFAWYQKAASQGDANSEFKVGDFYDNGVGVRRDYKQAIAWYERAAAQGNGAAMYNLGNLYDNGLGIAKNENTAISWFQKSAAFGQAAVAADPTDMDSETAVARSYNQLGEIYSDQGSMADAIVWYRKALNTFQIVQTNAPADQDAAKGAAQALGSSSEASIKTGAFTQGLDEAEQAIRLVDTQTSGDQTSGPPAPWLWLECNKADALMMLGRTDEARAIYLDPRNVAVTDDGTGVPWKSDVLSDLKTLGSPPLLAKIPQDKQATVRRFIFEIKSSFSNG
nr:tetratricopeptide repeat protein [Acidisoma sp. S159]